MKQDLWKIILQKPAETIKIHFVGVGGISMFGLAEWAHLKGYQTSGSDMSHNHRLDILTEMGIKIFPTQAVENIRLMMPDVVVRTVAVPLTHPEIQAAVENHIPVIDRGAFLGWITEQYNNVINIAGTHGKTTTTGMTAMILTEAALAPSLHIGATLPALGEHTIYVGPHNELFVSEACEYGNSFLHMRSTTACILNIDLDHVDFFGNMDRILESFVAFICKGEQKLNLVLPAVSENKYMPELLSLIRERFTAMNREQPQIFEFSLYEDSKAAYVAKNIRYIDGFPLFDVWEHGRFLIEINLRIPGEHNIANALAAIACSRLEGADANSCQSALAQFTGAEGRFSYKGLFQGAKVIADYAHHPTATTVTIKAAQNMPHNHIWVVYQPLTFNRVKALFQEYVRALLPCEEVLFYEIFSDREQDRVGMSSKLLVDAINEQGGHAKLYDSFEAIRERLREISGPDDMILFLGPEEVRSFADVLVSKEDSVKVD